MSEGMITYLFLTTIVFVLSLMLTIMNVTEIHDGGNDEWVRDAKRNTRLATYSMLAAPLWPLTLFCLLCYGGYKLARGVLAAFD